MPARSFIYRTPNSSLRILLPSRNGREHWIRASSKSGQRNRITRRRPGPDRPGTLRALSRAGRRLSFTDLARRRCRGRELVRMRRSKMKFLLCLLLASPALAAEKPAAQADATPQPATLQAPAQAGPAQKDAEQQPVATVTKVTEIGRASCREEVRME